MWLEECLVPQLQPGDVVVMDNASFHHSQSIEEVAQAGCELCYLPPYSPDLNPIEHWWFVLKNWMRQRWDEFANFRDCVDAAFKQCPKMHPYGYIVERKQFLAQLSLVVSPICRVLVWLRRTTVSDRRSSHDLPI
jgi:hypothetical protein